MLELTGVRRPASKHLTQYGAGQSKLRCSGPVKKYVLLSLMSAPSTRAWTTKFCSTRRARQDFQSSSCVQPSLCMVLHGMCAVGLSWRSLGSHRVVSWPGAVWRLRW